MWGAACLSAALGGGSSLHGVQNLEQARNIRLYLSQGLGSYLSVFEELDLCPPATTNSLLLLSRLMKVEVRAGRERKCSPPIKINLEKLGSVAFLQAQKLT